MTPRVRLAVALSIPIHVVVAVVMLAADWSPPLWAPAVYGTCIGIVTYRLATKLEERVDG